MSEENPRIGSTLESLLREDGIYEDAKNHAIKAVLAYKLTQAMKTQRSLRGGHGRTHGNQPLAA